FPPLLAMHSKCLPVHNGDWHTCDVTWKVRNLVCRSTSSSCSLFMENHGWRDSRSSSTLFKRRLSIGYTKSRACLRARYHSGSPAKSTVLKKSFPPGASHS